MNELGREKEEEINVLTQQMQMEQEEIRAEKEEIRALTEQILQRNGGGVEIQNAFIMQGLGLVLGCVAAGFLVYFFK